MVCARCRWLPISRNTTSSEHKPLRQMAMLQTQDSGRHPPDRQSGIDKYGMECRVGEEARGYAVVEEEPAASDVRGQRESDRLGCPRGEDIEEELSPSPLLHQPNGPEEPSLVRGFLFGNILGYYFWNQE
eukprot:GHVS01081751.1.p2 GENE.GHVS01081751.1~~GHVS01081751.1.p2  ORF type:complete len:130 (+),score=14.87 GHVS01081751.1:68-457(+)